MEEIFMNVYDSNTFVGAYDIDSFLKRKFGEAVPCSTPQKPALLFSDSKE